MLSVVVTADGVNPGNQTSTLSATADVVNPGKQTPGKQTLMFSAVVTGDAVSQGSQIPTLGSQMHSSTFSKLPGVNVGHPPNLSTPVNDYSHATEAVNNATTENHDISHVKSVEIEDPRTLSTLLQISADTQDGDSIPTLVMEQVRDPHVQELLQFIQHGRLPTNDVQARKLALQHSLFAIVDGVLYYIDPKRDNRKRAVVPKSLQQRLLEETHSGPFGAHFSGQRMFNTLVSNWWWEHMFTDTVNYAKSCPECAITTGFGRRVKPSLHPIPVERPFQILGIDIMDLPITENGNKHVIVIQDLFTKWPFVFAVPDQKAPRIARILAEEVVPWFGVPEALLSDRGTNLLSHLVLDLCRLLGVTKLNTSAYHPQCDGAVERFNRTLKQILRKHAARFGRQWDRYLPGILWAYRNTPHSSTGEKPSFLLFGVDCRSPTDAAFLPLSMISSTDVATYREELMLSLSSARDLAVETIQRSQTRYKEYYDQTTRETIIRVGDWVLVYFPHEETGRNRKLSKPWHGPYRVTSRRDPNFTCTKVYFPQHPEIKIHQSRVCLCPPGFPAGYFWYGGGRMGPGRPPKWVDKLLSTGPTTHKAPAESSHHNPMETDEGDCPENLLANGLHSDSEQPTEQSSQPDTPPMTGVTLPEQTRPQETNRLPATVPYSTQPPQGESSHSVHTHVLPVDSQGVTIQDSSAILQSPQQQEMTQSVMGDQPSDSSPHAIKQHGSGQEVNSGTQPGQQTRQGNEGGSGNTRHLDRHPGYLPHTRASRLRPSVKPPSRLMMVTFDDDSSRANFTRRRE